MISHGTGGQRLGERLPGTPAGLANGSSSGPGQHIGGHAQPLRQNHKVLQPSFRPGMWLGGLQWTPEHLVTETSFSCSPAWSHEPPDTGLVFRPGPRGSEVPIGAGTQRQTEVSSMTTTTWGLWQAPVSNGNKLSPWQTGRP